MYSEDMYSVLDCHNVAKLTEFWDTLDEFDFH
jgi:hypothetical protein